MSTGFLASANPRIQGCTRCGRLPERCCCQGKQTPGTFPKPDAKESLRPRDIPLERHLTDLAARAAGLTDDRGLRDFADRRAWPGGIRTDLDARQEIAEELADASSYACWGVERIWDRVEAGDPDAQDEYQRLLRALSFVLRAWDALLS